MASENGRGNAQTPCLICGTVTFMLETRICEVCWSVRRSPLGRFAVRMLGLLQQRSPDPRTCVLIVEEAQALASKLELL